MPPTEQALTLDIPSLTAALIRHFQLHEGCYQLNVGFRIGVGGFSLDGNANATPLPGAAIGVEGVSLTRIPDGVSVPHMVDASQVNPFPKPPPKARIKKG
jgi:hypothetical protein